MLCQPHLEALVYLLHLEFFKAICSDHHLRAMWIQEVEAVLQQWRLFSHRKGTGLQMVDRLFHSSLRPMQLPPLR